MAVTTIDLGYVRGPQGAQGAKGDPGVNATTTKCATSSLKGLMSAEDKARLDDIVSEIYPVGSVYVSTSNTSPASRFGGTWTAISGAFLYTVSTAEKSMSVGGSNDAVVVSHNHSASSASAGEHRHPLRLPYMPDSGSQTIIRDGLAPLECVAFDETYWGGGKRMQASGAHTHAVTVNSTGVSGTNKNMPKYFTVYAWYRVS